MAKTRKCDCCDGKGTVKSMTKKDIPCPCCEGRGTLPEK